MSRAINDEAGAAPTAPAPGIAGVANPTANPYPESGGAANAVGAGQPGKRPVRGKLCIFAQGPSGQFVARGQTAKALVALVRAGKAGVTALEVSSWAYRLGAYVHRLRHENGLAIETVREKHEGGWHGRYVLHSPVTFSEAGR